MNIKYYLQRAQEVNSLIQISISWQGKRLQLSTGITIPSKNWSKVKGSVKSSGKNSLEINLYLERLKSMLAQYYIECKGLNITITKEELRQKIRSYINPLEDIRERSLVDIFSNFIDTRTESGKYQAATIKKYNTTLNHLKEFKNKTGYDISFENMNQEFCDKFLKYLSGTKGLINSTSKMIIKILKTFLLDALDQGITNNGEFVKGFAKSLKHFNSSDDSRLVSLSMAEIEEIENLELNKKLDKVRNLFLLQCYTGLRYSDLNNLKPENFNIKEKVIIAVTIKTEKPLRIPIHGKLIKLIEKYPDFKFPKYSNQKYNDYIKEVCKEADMIEPVLITNFRGRKREETIYKKYELISSHTARRSFITVLLKQGVLPEEIMQITGHKNRATFDKYVRIAREDAMDSVKKAWG